MSKQILVTGGAGFVGSHLCDELLTQGYRVRVLDVLSQQVHGATQRPDYLHDDVELVAGDVCDPQAIRQALQGVDAVYHLAAMVGVGQSMYQIARYTEVNNMGTAVLLEALIENPVERLVVASSMSIYGEGLYRDADGQLVAGSERPLSQLKNRDWEVRDSQHRVLDPVPTPEWKQPALASVYALSKFDQE
ncbi:MAG TPA: NAD-dependent epimerase/dehydratase family protein, partial [Abditibacteriaceae bacterium]|nr:NAD-dependent epimerase/dehydratase family protein [Abditibacteriaceae bacterium]